MSINRVYIDIETRSRCDINAFGAYIYARDESTAILCITTIAFHHGHKEPVVTNFVNENILGYVKTAYNLNHFNAYMQEHYPPTSTMLVAHNADFEYNILKCVQKFPAHEYHWHCTLSKCLAAGLPPALKNAALALQCGKEKFDYGKWLIATYSTPIKTKLTATDKKRAEIQAAKERNSALFAYLCAMFDDWDNGDWAATKLLLELIGTDKEETPIFRAVAPQDREELIKYCQQDAEVAVEVDKRIPPTFDKPHYLKDTLAMNSTGLPVDVDTAKRVVKVLSSERAHIIAQHTINLNSPAQIRRFAEESNYPLNDVTETTVQKALNDPTLPDALAHVLRDRQKLSKSSTAKYQTIIDHAYHDRMLGCFRYYGAHTGRDAGRLVQPQNFPRGDAVSSKWLPHIDMPYYELFCPDVFEGARNGLRSIIRSHKGFLCGDFVGIETRVLLWLAGDESNLTHIKNGQDLYKVMASRIYAIPYDDVTLSMRAVGKAAVLGLGYGMGSGYDASGQLRTGAKGAMTGFKKYSEAAQLDLDKRMLIRTVELYRTLFAPVVALWRSFEEQFIEAMQGNVPAGENKNNIHFKRSGNFMLITLPSKRRLIYAYPKLDEDLSITYLSAKPTATRDKDAVVINGVVLYRHYLYGGKITENIVQAVARDILFNAVDNLNAKKYKIIGRFHDEILCEKNNSEQNLKEFLTLMKIKPDWVDKNLPLDVEGWEGNYYRK